MEILKAILESPTLSGLVVTAVAQVWVQVAKQLNGAKRPSGVLVQLALALMSFAAYVLNGWQDGTLNTDPKHVQELVNYYGNTLALYFGGKAAGKALVAKSEEEKTDAK